MHTVVTTPPASPLIPLSVLKQHLRLDADDASQDVVLTTMLASAVATIDGPDGWLGRALGPQQLELRAERFPSEVYGNEWREVIFDGYDACAGIADRAWLAAQAIVLPCPPIVSVQNVRYRDPDGNAVTLDPSAYALSERVLLPSLGTSWPITLNGPGAVAVAYAAGYACLPQAIRGALLLMTAALYENRESGGASVLGGTPEALLQPFRLYL